MGRGRPTKEEVANRSQVGLKRLDGNASEVITAIGLVTNEHPRAKFTDPDEIYGLCVGYFQHITELNEVGSSVYPDMYSLASWIGTTPQTIDRYIKENINGLAPVFSWAKNCIASVLSQMAFNGKINPLVFTATMNNMHDWTTNRTQTEITHIKAEKPSLEQLLEEAEQLPIEGEFKEIE